MHPLVKTVRAAIVAILSITTVQTAVARDADWVVLGATTAAAVPDQDDINVGQGNGAFDSLRVDVRDNDVFIKSIRVTSYDGAEETFEINQLVKTGRSLEPIRLRGRLQTVRDIRLDYKASGRSGSGRATVTVSGSRAGRDSRVADDRDDRRGGRDDRDRDNRYNDDDGERGRFVPIDTQTSDRRAERMVFRTERGEGRLSQIRFKATRETARIGDVTIVFGNGDSQTVEVTERIDEGETTRVIPVDLTPDRRRVEEVIVSMRPSFRRGTFEVELSGLRSPGYARPDGDDRREPPRYQTETGAPRGGWVLFGSQAVGFGVDRDVIRVGREAGQFDKIALRVLKNDIYLREVTVVFGNGERQVVPVNVELKEGFRTAPLPLDRGDRFIETIELVYQSKPDRRGEAVVEVYGDYSDRWLRDSDDQRRDRSGGWLMLGAQRAELFNADYDTFEVGERFGRFKALRIAVKDHAVRIRGMRVVYGNGEVEDVAIRAELQRGQSTDALEIEGRGRFIQRIELAYRTKLNFKGEGTVEVWGLK